MNDPWRSSSRPTIAELQKLDSDGDGIPDADELALGTDPFSADSDRDGLSDREEFARTHTNPRSADTDHDGILDQSELRAGRNPRVAEESYLTNDQAEEIGEIAFALLSLSNQTVWQGPRYCLEYDDSSLWVRHWERGELLHQSNDAVLCNRLTLEDKDVFQTLQMTLDQEQPSPAKSDLEPGD